VAALVRRRTERRPGAILGRSVQTVRQVRALHAAATAYDLSNLTRGDAHRLMAYRQGWQERAYGYRSDVGELRYAVAFLANAAKRMMFYPAVYMPGERVPVPIEDSDLKQHAAITHDALDRLGDVGCRSTLASDQMAGFEVAGECYLVSREDDSDGIKREVWEMRSLSEVQASEDGKVLIKDTPGNVGATWTSRDSSVYVMQPDDYLARMWRPDPQWRRLADSPVRAAESVLEELVILGKDVRAGGVSRLVNNGILLIPDDLMAVRNSTGLDDEAGDDEDDEFLVQMIEAATTAIMDPGSAAAALPIVARGPAETLDKVKLLAMVRPEDKNADKRQEALRRLATAMDLPAEVLTGIADVNHWGAWQVDDSTFRHHVEPLVQDEVDSWTAAYFRRYLTAAGVPEDAVSRMVIWYDPTELLTKPDRSTDAKDAHTAHALSNEALRRHLGFTEDEAPSDEELAVRLLFQSRTLDPDLAKQLVLLLDPRLKMPEPQPPVIAPPPPPGGEQPPGEQTPETGPAPSETGPPPEAEGLRARVTELRALAAERGSAAELRRRVVELKAAKAAEVTELEALLAASHVTPDWAYDLSRRMAERDQQTREALRMACEHAVRRVLERAGNKVVTRARQKDALTASTLAGVPQWAVPGRLGPAVVAALGLSEDALLKDELVDLRRTWDQYVGTGQTQALRDAARLVGMDVNTAFAQLDGTFRADREAGWSFLREVLDRNIRAGLVKDPTELVETGQLVPTSGVRAAIAVAGGYDTRTSSGLNSETLLPADPKEHFGQLGTGTTIRGFLEQNGAKVERYRWSHGLSISPFPPHAALDGFEFDDWDDTRLLHAGFPGDLHPGDHSGCNCDAVLVWVPPARAQPPGGILTDDAALAAVPADDSGIVGDYQLLGNAVNRKLRTEQVSDRDRDLMAGLDSMFAKHPALSEAIMVHRGVGDGTKIFGPVGQAGTVWTDRAYISTTTDRSMTEVYGGVETALKIRIPAGNKAIHLDGGAYGGSVPGEVLLPRGTVFEIASDEMVGEVRRLELVVIQQIEEVK
jgi:hypothetical protein